MYNSEINQKENLNSIYVDCALSGNFKTLLSLLRDFKLDPSPDINFYYKNEKSEHRVSALSVCLQNCDSTPKAIECVIEMEKRGVNFDIYSRLVGSFETSIRFDQGNRSVPIHALEIIAKLKNPEIHNLVLRKLPKQRIQELLDTTSTFAIAVAADNLSLVNFFLENFKVDLNKEIIKPDELENVVHSMAEAPFIVNNAKTIEMLGVLVKNGASLIKQSSAKVPKTALQKITENKSVAKSFLSCATEAAMSQSLAVKLKNSNAIDGTKLDSNAYDVDPMITSSLFTAIEQKNANNTEALIKSIGKKNIANITNFKGENLLFAAINVKNFTLAKKMLSYGCSLHQYDKAESSNPLIRFLTLSHQRWEDRDPRGVRRAEMRHTIFELADFNVKNSKGEPLLWSLYFTPLDFHGTEGRISLKDGHLTKSAIVENIFNSFPKTSDGKIDIFYKNSEGVSFIEYVIKEVTFKPLLKPLNPHGSLIYNLKSEVSLKELLLVAGKSSDLTVDFARELIKCFFANSKNFWQSTNVVVLTSSVNISHSDSHSIKDSKIAGFLKEIFEPIFDKASFGPQDEEFLKGLVMPEQPRFKEFSAFFENKILNSLLSEGQVKTQKRTISL